MSKRRTISNPVPPSPMASHPSSFFRFPLFPLSLLFSSLLLFFPHPSPAADDPAVEQRRTIHLLIRDLADPKSAVRDDAARKLTALGEPALPDLLLALDGRHVAVSTMPAERAEIARARAASVLASLGGERARTHLLNALNDKSPLVRRSAVDALGSLKCKEAVPELLKLLAGNDPALASDAATALGNIGDKAAVKDLRATLADPAALKTRFKDDADLSRIRSAAAIALALIGDTAAVPDLLAALRDPDSRVREHADLALRKLSGRNLGFKPDTPEPDRERVIKAWIEFWKAKAAP